MKALKFGYIDLTGVQESNVHKFDKEYLTGNDKFIQIEIFGQDYLRVGNFYHRRILKETLIEFGVSWEETKNRMGIVMPFSEGKDYKLVGAGEVNFENELKFWDTSSDYLKQINGTNKKNLDSIFGKEKIKQNGQTYFGPIFLVKEYKMFL